MSKTTSLILLVFLGGCATVGPVEVTPDDTWFTISTALFIAILVFLIKGYVEYFFAKKLERYKKELEKE